MRYPCGIVQNQSQKSARSKSPPQGWEPRAAACYGIPDHTAKDFGFFRHQAAKARAVRASQITRLIASGDVVNGKLRPRPTTGGRV